MRLLVALGVSLLAACSSYMRTDVEGRVVDGDGVPVPDARVSLAWQDGVRTLVCDAAGHYEGTMALPSSIPALFAADNEWERGAIVALSAAPQTVVLRPLARVTGRLDLGRINPLARGGPSDMSIVSSSLPAFVTSMPVRDDRFDLRLPPGEYELRASGRFKTFIHPFTVGADAGPVDLGRLQPEPATLYELFGREAPELVAAEARGVPKEGALASLRGKWVLLFFFSHNLRVNREVYESVFRLYEELRDHRDRFEVVMVHQSDDVVSLRDLEWVGVRLPMPVVIDDNGRTFERYGFERGRSRSMPHELLVGPDGKVEPVSQPMAAQKLLLEKLAAAK